MPEFRPRPTVRIGKSEQRLCSSVSFGRHPPEIRTWPQKETRIRPQKIRPLQSEDPPPSDAPSGSPTFGRGPSFALLLTPALHFI